MENTRKTGHYFGTEIDEKWWKRYKKEHMFARGKGAYWYDGEAFYFLKMLTKTPMAIPFGRIVGFKTGKWHAGQWAGGRRVLKIIWEREGLRLSSGFTIPGDAGEFDALVLTLKRRAGAAEKPSS
jgi:hypothetical protein